MHCQSQVSPYQTHGAHMSPVLLTSCCLGGRRSGEASIRPVSKAPQVAPSGQIGQPQVLHPSAVLPSATFSSFLVMIIPYSFGKFLATCCSLPRLSAKSVLRQRSNFLLLEARPGGRAGKGESREETGDTTCVLGWGWLASRPCVLTFSACAHPYFRTWDLWRAAALTFGTLRRRREYKGGNEHLVALRSSAHLTPKF